MTTMLLPTYKESAFGKLDSANRHPNLHRISRNPVVDTEVEACFALRDETDPIVSLSRVRDKLGFDGCPSHDNLFRASPTIWVTEDEYNVCFDRIPDGRPKSMGIFYIRLRTNEEVVHEVGENVGNGKAEG